MPALNLPPFPAKIECRGGKRVIFDPLRRRYVALTPEEWVRQHFTHFLTAHRGYPPALLANEVQLRLGLTVKRCDTLLYTPGLAPLMIVEYKAAEVAVDSRVWQQVARYNMALRAGYLVVSNGLVHFCGRMSYDPPSCTFLPDIPFYADL